MPQKNRIWRQIMGGLLLSALFCGCASRALPGGETGSNKVFAADMEKEMFFSLTQEEEDYLASLRGQTVFAGVADTGAWEMQGDVACGAAAPLVDVLHYEFGLDVRVVQGTWAENRAAMQDGSLDLLVGVPAVAQEEEDEGEGLYQSAWLYENPYLLVEYIGKNPLLKESSAGMGIHTAEEEEISGGVDVLAKDADKPTETGLRAAKEDNTSGGSDQPAKESGDSFGTVSDKIYIAYMEQDPFCEIAIRHLKKAPGLYFGKTNTPSALEFFPCADADAVLAALSAGRAQAGIVPEDAIFLHYPARDFSVLARLEAYGSRTALGAADEKLLPLLKILDRYLEETGEGEELRGAMHVQWQARREEWVRKKEGGILKKLRSRGEELQYAQAGLDSIPYFWHDAAGAHGELADFLAFVTAHTGLSFCQSETSGEAALQALEDGEILFAAGVPFLGNGQAYCFAGEEIRDVLVMVVHAEEAGQFLEKNSNIEERDAVAQRYWGVVQEMMPLLSETMFDGHVVGFPDEGGLLDAMQAGEIGGMLLGRGSFDALFLAGEDAYTALEGAAFPVKSGLAFSRNDQKAAELFGRLWQFYRALGHGSKTATGAGQAQEDAAAQYRAAYAQLLGKKEKLTHMVWGFGAAAAFCAAAFLLARRGAKKKRKG